MNTQEYAQGLTENKAPFTIHTYSEGWHDLAAVDHATNTALSSAIMRAGDWLDAAIKWLFFIF